MTRIYATIPVNVYSLRPIRQPRAVQCRIALQRGLMNRLRHAVLASDWEGWLCRAWIDKACLGVVAVSLLYFPLFVFFRLCVSFR